MKKFPEKLKPKYRHLFTQLNFNEILENWRNKIYSYILSNDKNGLDICIDNKPIDKKFVDCLRLELLTLGWNTKLGYNGTVLFIYENEIEIEKYKHILCEDIFE
jgi:hypothetical protein